MCIAFAIPSQQLLTARTLFTLKNETEALMAEGMNYDEGQLPLLIPGEYRQITRVELPISCDPGYVEMAERSTCPWRFQKNIDENRIPREITEAVCRASNSGVCGRATSRNQTIRNGCRKHECREVKYFTKVLRRFSPNTNEYREVLEPISAGCTCMCSALRPFSHSGRNRMCQ